MPQARMRQCRLLRRVSPRINALNFPCLQGKFLQYHPKPVLQFPTKLQQINLSFLKNNSFGQQSLTLPFEIFTL